MPLFSSSKALSNTEPGVSGNVSFEHVAPIVPEAGFVPRLKALLLYLTCTEVHTYAFSVAANAILSLFPFIVLLLTLSRLLFHSRAGEGVVATLMKTFLPTGQDFVMRNMELLAHPGKGTQVFSGVMLLISSTGVFMPLEVALNGVWGVRENRSYLRNQLVSLGLAFGVGVLAMLSVWLSWVQKPLLGMIFFGHVNSAAYLWLANWFVRLLAAMASVGAFFLVYWVLPNRKIPALAVLPTAIAMGLLWQMAKFLYVHSLPWLDFPAVYGPFYISVGLMVWAFLTGLLLLAGAHFSSTRFALRTAREAEREEVHG